MNIPHLLFTLDFLYYVLWEKHKLKQHDVVLVCMLHVFKTIKNERTWDYKRKSDFYNSSW